MKKMTLPVAVFVAIVGCVLAVSANVTTSKIHQDLNQERYKRMLAESQLQEAQKKINGLETAMDDSHKKIQGIQEILNKGQSTTVDLQAQVDGIRKERDSLILKIQQMQMATRETPPMPQVVKPE